MLTMYKRTQAEIDLLPIAEGNIFFNTTNKEITVDDDGSRTHYGGTVTIDSTLSTTSVNPVQNQVLGNIIGDTDISTIGDGTTTGAISTINTAIGTNTTNIAKLGTVHSFDVVATIGEWTAETGGYYREYDWTGLEIGTYLESSMVTTAIPTTAEVTDNAKLWKVDCITVNKARFHIGATAFTATRTFKVIIGGL